MIKFSNKGDFNRLTAFLSKMNNLDFRLAVSNICDRGLIDLKNATPVKTGKTSESWTYKLKNGKNGLSIVWENENLSDGVSVAMLIQYGHAMPDGSYIEGIDYINPVLEPIFKEIEKEIRKEVSKRA